MYDHLCACRFLYKLKRISDMQNILSEYVPSTLPATTLLQAKKSGFSDKQVGSRTGATEAEIRKRRLECDITPFVKQVGTGPRNPTSRPRPL